MKPNYWLLAAFRPQTGTQVRKVFEGDEFLVDMEISLAKQEFPGWRIDCLPVDKHVYHHYLDLIYPD